MDVVVLDVVVLVVVAQPICWEIQGTCETGFELVSAASSAVSPKSWTHASDDG